MSIFVRDSIDFEWTDFGHRWYLRKNNVDEPIDEINYSHDIRIIHHPQQHLSKIGQLKRIFVRDGGTLTINDIKRTDSGVYICIATNSEGSETLEIQLTVIESLTAQIQPAQQTVDLGKSADLVSTNNNAMIPTTTCSIFSLKLGTRTTSGVNIYHAINQISFSIPL